MVLIEVLIRIVSGVAALMLVTAGVLALRKFPIPSPILSAVRVFYSVLWPAPALFLVLLAALVVRARWILGFWPYPHRFDPSRFPSMDSLVASPLDATVMPIHFWSALVVFYVAALAIPWAIPAYALLRAAGRRSHPATLSILVSGWVALLLLPLCDPGGYFDWFID